MLDFESNESDMTFYIKFAPQMCYIKNLGLGFEVQK